MALSDVDVDETMAADWSAIREKYATEEPETPIEPETPELEQAAAPETRARDESTGRYVKAEDKPDGSSKPPKEERSPKVSPETPARGATQAGSATPEDAGTADPGSIQNANARAVDVNRAPSSWKPTERALWDKVDPAVRAAIHRRETEMAAGAQQLMPDAQFGKGLRQVIEPYRMLIEAEGGTPERAVADLMRTAAVFRVGTPEQKLNAVAGIVRQFGIDLRPLIQPQQQSGQQQPAAQQQAFRDPRVDQLLAHQRQQEIDSQAQKQAEMEATVNRWINEVDVQGESTKPYLKDVLGEVSALIPQLREANPALTTTQVLEEAYQRAIWAHPEVRTVLQQKAAADLAAQRQADNQTRLRDAKRAASVNVPRRASIPSAGKPGSLEETIAATARELGLIST